MQLMAASLEQRIGIINQWSTPMYQQILDGADNFNDALIDEIAREGDAGASLSLGMVRAHKTGFSILHSDSGAIAELHNLIFKAAHTLNQWCIPDLAEQVADSMISEAWAVIYKDYGYHKLHLHHGSAWSGVYYVRTGILTPGTGAIELLDPRQSARPQSSAGGLIRIDPKPGMLIAFPSWVQHFVTPVEGASERICIAFNVGFDREVVE